MKHAGLLLLLGAACGADVEHACTLIGCDSGAQFEFGALVDADLARATVEVRINSTCRDDVIYELPQPTKPTYVRLGQGLDPRIEVWLSRTDPNGAIEIEVAVASGQPELFDDGDIYRVSIVAADGGQLIDRRWSVSYRTWQPNGPDCEPTCRSATTTTEL